jgi:dihydroorotate dehydrogenase (NAD+) catalytic subunit
VIGLGGIRTVEDALEFLIVGAQAVQIGTANFSRPRAALEIIQGLRNFLIARGSPNVKSLIGSIRC